MKKRKYPAKFENISQKLDFLGGGIDSVAERQEKVVGMLRRRPKKGGGEGEGDKEFLSNVEKEVHKVRIAMERLHEMLDEGTHPTLPQI